MNRPNPGSEKAREKGCECPRMDNNNGKRPPMPPSGWWINPDCPLHGRAHGKGRESEDS